MKTKEEMQKTFVNSTDKFSFSSLINEVIFLGKLTKEVEIQGMKFEIKTLTEEESRSVVEKLFRIPEASRMACIRSMTLSKAIDKIGGYDFTEIASSVLQEEGKEVNDRTVEFKKNEIVLKLQTSVTNDLFAEYEKLIEKKEEASGGSEIKNS
jgi:hypothetical protein